MQALGPRGEDADEGSHEQRGNHGPLAHALHAAEKDEAQEQGGGHQRDVEEYLDTVENPFVAVGDGDDDAFARQHGYIADDFHADAEPEDRAADHAHERLKAVDLRHERRGQGHAHIDEDAEQEDRRELHKMRGVEVLAQNGFLPRQKEHVEQKGQGTEAQPEDARGHVGQARDGRRAQIGVGDQPDAQRADEKRRAERAVAPQKSFPHVYPYSGPLSPASRCGEMPVLRPFAEVQGEGAFHPFFSTIPQKGFFRALHSRRFLRARQNAAKAWRPCAGLLFSSCKAVTHSGRGAKGSRFFLSDGCRGAGTIARRPGRFFSCHVAGRESRSGRARVPEGRA